MKKIIYTVSAVVLTIAILVCFVGCTQTKTTNPVNEVEAPVSDPTVDISGKTGRLLTVQEIPEAVASIDWGEGITLSDVKATYVSEEYYEEKAYNNISNYFLGYTAEDLLDLNGDAWFFSVDDEGEVSIDIVDRATMLAEYEKSMMPTQQNNVLRNFLIGGGVILITATLSVFGSPAVACISLSAFKGAVVGATLGSAVYAAGTAISYRVSEGTWSGAGKEVLTATSEGFALGAIVGGISGALTASNCFPAGTPVVLAGGETLPIEKISIGTEVVACAVEENPYRTYTGTVVNVFSKEVETTTLIRFENETIEATPEHPMYVVEKGWVDACQLSIGDKVLKNNGETASVCDVTELHYDEPVSVYNFEVEKYHTYYVGENGYLVHNSCLHLQKDWATERASHWKQSGQFYRENYALYKNQAAASGKYIVNEANVQRMLAGKAPLDVTGHAVQLHHTHGIASDMYSYVELTQAEHYANFKNLHYWLHQ